MLAAEIKVVPSLNLKPNRFFDQVEIPYLYQKRAALIMYSRPRMILGDDVGLGKSSPIGTGVLTPFGWMPIEELKPGDKVVGSQGTPVTVTGVFPRGLLPTYRVSFNDGSSLRVGPDHLWAVRTETNSRRGKPFEIRDTKSLKGDLRHPRHGQAKWRIPLVKPVEFEGVLEGIPAYLLGVWLGDGSGSAIMAHDSSRVPHEVGKVLPEGWVMNRCDPEDRVPVYRIKGLTHGENPLTDFLRKEGLEGKRSWEKFIPNCALFSRIQDRVDLLQGLIDTDGEIREDAVIFHSTSEQMARQVMFLVQSLGGLARLTSKIGRIGDKEYRRCYCVNFNLEGVKFARAKEMPAPRVKYKPSRVMVSIEEEGADEHVCISVDAEDHLYVTEDCIVTHNTLESIVAFSYMKTRDPELRAVIFTEKSALLQWQKEIKWLCPELKVAVVTAESHPDPKKRKAALHDTRYDIKISTYYTVYHYLEDLRKGLGTRYAVFADECNYFKNSDTKMFKQMRSLCDQAVRAYGMSATIIENRLEEAYCILRVIAPGIIPSRKYFENMFCVKKKSMTPAGKTVTNIVGYKNIPQFKKLIEPVFYGRLQTNPEVEQQLPEDVHKDVLVMMGKEQSIKYLEAENGLLRTAEDSYVQLGVFAQLTICQQLSNSPAIKGFSLPSAKEEALIEQLTNSLLGEKVVIFSKYRTQIDRIEVLIKAAGLKCGRITGSEDTDQREANRVAFQSDDKTAINILLITKAGQKALNLQKAGHIILFDMPWSYGMYRQIVGRAKRTGSVHTHIGVYRYISVIHPDVATGTSTNTIDHHILEVLLRKKSLFNAVLDDDTSIESTDADLMDVYRAIIKDRKVVQDAVM